MKIHCLQHVSFEGLGSIENWIRQNGFQLTYTKFFEPDYHFPEMNDFDFLIIMGGPMGVYDEDKYVWMESEKKFIFNSIHANKKVLGICLGAQLIASVLGAKVYPNHQKEIGWFDIKSNLSNKNPLFLENETKIKVFHWHGDTFDLPLNSKLFASNSVCENQAFIYKGHVVGLQFHLEITLNSLTNMLQHCADELLSAPFIQSAQEILSQNNYIPLLNLKMNKVLDFLVND